MIQIYYGFGKGKTTAAIGQGMRAKGAGNTVTLVQFLKDNKSSELSVLPFDIFNAPDTLPFNPGKEYQAWVDSAIAADKALGILDMLGGREIVITGHKKVERLFEKADYITFMDKIKHPYDMGVKARKGIEY